MAGINQYAKSLLLPDGEIRPLREKDVYPLNALEVRMLSWLHEWAHKWQITLICKRCDHAIQGANNDSPDIKFVAVSCLCREWRYDRR